MSVLRIRFRYYMSAHEGPSSFSKTPVIGNLSKRPMRSWSREHITLALVEEANAGDADGSGVEAGGGVFQGDAAEGVDRDG